MSAKSAARYHEEAVQQIISQILNGFDKWNICMETMGKEIDNCTAVWTAVWDGVLFRTTNTMNYFHSTFSDSAEIMYTNFAQWHLSAVLGACRFLGTEHSWTT